MADKNCQYCGGLGYVYTDKGEELTCPCADNQWDLVSTAIVAGVCLLAWALIIGVVLWLR